MWTTNVEDEGFEMLTQEETLQKDRELLANQLSDLFKSKPISLEQKGYIISLMHVESHREAVTDILWREII